MAIVSKPDGKSVTLYDIPDDQLEQYKMSAEDAGKMFPKKDGRTRDDASAVATAGSTGGDVQAYSNQDICYAWECDGYGNCVYVWWYC